MKGTKPDPGETRLQRPVPVLQQDEVSFNGAYVARGVERGVGDLQGMRGDVRQDHRHRPRR